MFTGCKHKFKGYEHIFKGGEHKFTVHKYKIYNKEKHLIFIPTMKKLLSRFKLKSPVSE